MSSHPVRPAARRPRADRPFAPIAATARCGLLAAVLACGGLLAGAAAAGESDCGLFPDFDRDCERVARPKGSVMPMSFPFLFEDPYITTGTNAVGIWHEFPSESVFWDGDISVVALQARLAITDRLAFIATKDGYGWIDSENPVLDVSDDSGFFNIGAGFKYAVWRWEEEGQGAILTPSLRYEIPLGQKAVFQHDSDDDGTLIPALSAGYHNDGWHVVADVGGQWGIDRDVSSSSIFYNVHVDHAFPVSKNAESALRYVVPFVELNGIHYVRSGDGSRLVKTRLGSVPLKAGTQLLGLAPFEGVDIINLGADAVAGGDLVTMAWGVRFPVGEGLSFGASYERPLSTRKDLFEQRVTVMITWEL